MLREPRRGQVFRVNPLTGLLGFLGARNHLDGGGEEREPIRMRMHRHSSVPGRRRRAQPAIEAKPPTIAP